MGQKGCAYYMVVKGLFNKIKSILGTLLRGESVKW
jgi:hypothetical protein